MNTRILSKRFYLLSFIILNSLFAFQACNRTKAPFSNALSSSKKEYLSVVDILLEKELVYKQFDSLKISLQDIVMYCRQSQALVRKSKLISLACGRMENYLEEENPNYWLAILYDVERFCETVAVFKEKKHLTFMDIGSGNGEKPYAALAMGFEKTFGLEYSQKLVELSRKSLADFISQKQMEIISGDALLVDPKIYGQIDFIYMYSPIKNHPKMAELCAKVMQNMKNGSILLEMRLVYAPELRKITDLKIPDLMDIALKKENNRFYYAHYQAGEKEWFPLEKM